MIDKEKLIASYTDQALAIGADRHVLLMLVALLKAKGLMKSEDIDFIIDKAPEDIKSLVSSRLEPLDI